MDDLQRLTINEDLRRLMARYVYAADHHNWDQLAALFTPDGTFTHSDPEGNPAQPLRGREDIRTTIPAGLGPDAVLIHHLFSDEIDVQSAASAHGVWSMEDIITRPASVDENGTAQFTSMHGFGHYRPHFTKIDGTWYIAELNLTRLRVDWTY